MALLVGEALGEMRRGAAVALGLQQAREQLLGRLTGLEVEQLLVLAGQHQARLQLQQRRDEHEELGRDLEVELPAGLQEVQVGDHDVGQLDLEQVDLLAQDERQQEVERPGEDLQVQLERSHGHGANGSGRARRHPTAASAVTA